MTNPIANPNGIVTGKFTIPAGVSAGTKPVVVMGAGGTRAVATFTGRGTITTEERRRVVTQQWQQNRADPLAQTFTLPESRHCAGVKLWFSAKGNSPVLVQIHETDTGLPTQVVLAEKQVQPGGIVTNGSETQILFDAPVWLNAGTEYAIVVLTDSPVTALWIAKLGGFDTSQQRRVTSQAYQVGTLLSSSNGSTWTAHQDADLTFILLGARFVSQSKTIALGSVSVSNCSDLLGQFSAETPATGTSAEMILTTASGEAYRLLAGSPVALPSRLSGNLALSLVLRGTATASPVVYPGLQFIEGRLRDDGDYVSRAFAVGSSARVSVVYEALTPGTSSMTVEIQKTDGTWQTVPAVSGTPVGDGWVERKHELTGFTATTSKIRITEQGTAQYRPFARKLRSVTTD